MPAGWGIINDECLRRQRNGVECGSNPPHLPFLSHAKHQQRSQVDQRHTRTSSSSEAGAGAGARTSLNVVGVQFRFRVRVGLGWVGVNVDIADDYEVI